MTRSHVALAALALLGLSSTGCLIISSNRSAPAPPPARIVYRPDVESGRVDLLTREIDAAAALNFEEGRVEAMQRIARRVPLRPDAQARLVWAAYLRLNFEQNKVAVIRTILENPSCDDAGRAAVLDGLDHLSFEQSRRELLERIDQRTL